MMRPKRVRAKLNAELTIAGILPTIYKPRTLHSQEVLELVKSAFGEQVFGITIDSSIRFAETPLAGQSILQYAPSSPGARAYRALAKTLLNGGARAVPAEKADTAVVARPARHARAAKA